MISNTSNNNVPAYMDASSQGMTLPPVSNLTSCEKLINPLVDEKSNDSKKDMDFFYLKKIEEQKKVIEEYESTISTLQKQVKHLDSKLILSVTSQIESLTTSIVSNPRSSVLSAGETTNQALPFSTFLKPFTILELATVQEKPKSQEAKNLTNSPINLLPQNIVSSPNSNLTFAFYA
ncbi:MAG: hypothetical protein K0S74_83 [Chlamydiales bacterium]|jgi:hypothetical protein|nr:hypothetical protein [Chlamydiales bacterium]